MSDTRFATVLLRDIIGYSSSFTSKTTEISLKPLGMHILEMEDVLFHLNSSVMMPESPSGKSSADGVASDGPGGDLGDDFQEDQQNVTGIKALALVYKQFELDPKVQMVIAGHTDTSGTPKFNFKLSEERARNVLYLLTGEKELWADVSEGRHKIEDYQQIMRHYALKKGWACDPEKVDDKWGDKTKKACREFFKQALPGSPGETDNIKTARADALVAEVEGDSKKRWPKRAWEAVFDLYIEDLCEFMDMEKKGFKEYASATIKYIDDTKKYVACGESFPIDDREKKNYRSQVNRRVEIVFFDEDEKPTLDCPVIVDRVHKEEECPLWDKTCYIPLYIDPLDLYAVIYHLRFVYYDRVKDKLMSVPEGLQIKAYQKMEGMVEDELLPTEAIFSDGVYNTKVQFTSELDDPKRKMIYFQFEGLDEFGKRSWIYTANKDAEPVIVKKTPPEYAALSFEEKWKHYNLPDNWSSRNYWTRYDGDLNKGERFEKVLKDVKSLKPFGDNKTASDKPLVFSLDDIVLADSGRKQDIKDQGKTGANKDLDAKSRYTLFYIDDTDEPGGYKKITSYKDKKGKIKIYKQDPDEPVFTKAEFKENLITDVPGNTRVIYFCNGFYDVYDKRSSKSDKDFDAGKHVLGARLALKNDSDVHISKSVNAGDANDIAKAYALTNCGNYELHYFHNCWLLNNKPLAYLFIYWSCRFQNSEGGTPADITNHRKSGMSNAILRLNKDYMVEKSSGPDDINLYIRLFYFMEAKNDTNGGLHKALVQATDNSGIAWMLPTTARFRARDYQNDPAYFGAADPDNTLADTDGSVYQVLTNHHEMGHATGNWDDYLYTHEGNWKGVVRKWSGLPMYDQPYTAVGGPYSCDNLSRMFHNRTPRMRNFWKFICWLHDDGKPVEGITPAGPLYKFFKGSKFKITFKGDKGGTSFTHNYELKDIYRNVAKAAKNDLDHSIAADAKVDLLLYKLGDDETSHFSNLGKMSNGYQTLQIFKGILAVKIKFAIRYDDGTGGAWIFNDALAWARSLNNDMKNVLNGKFHIKCSDAGNDFSNNYVYFTPHFSVYEGGPPANSHFNIRVKYQNGGNFSISGKNIQVDFDTDKSRIIRYCFGKATGTAALTKGDFPSIVNWVKTAAGDATFTMNDL